MRIKKVTLLILSCGFLISQCSYTMEKKLVLLEKAQTVGTRAKRYMALMDEIEKEINAGNVIPQNIIKKARLYTRKYWRKNRGKAKGSYKYKQDLLDRTEQKTKRTKPPKAKFGPLGDYKEYIQKLPTGALIKEHKKIAQLKKTPANKMKLKIIDEVMNEKGLARLPGMVKPPRPGNRPFNEYKQNIKKLTNANLRKERHSLLKILKTIKAKKPIDNKTHLVYKKKLKIVNDEMKNRNLTMRKKIKITIPEVPSIDISEIPIPKLITDWPKIPSPGKRLNKFTAYKQKIKNYKKDALMGEFKAILKGCIAENSGERRDYQEFMKILSEEFKRKKIKLPKFPGVLEEEEERVVSLPGREEELEEGEGPSSPPTPPTLPKPGIGPLDKEDSPRELLKKELEKRRKQMRG